MALKIVMVLSLFGMALAGIDYFETLNDEFHYATLSPEELKEHIDCFLATGPCNDLVGSFQRHFQEAVDTACGRCNDGQKNIGYTLVEAVKKYYPERLAGFQQKYDPDNTKMEAFFKSLKPSS